MTWPPQATRAEEERKKWVACVIRAWARYEEVWIPCWNASPGGIDPELGYFDALKGSD